MRILRWFAAALLVLLAGSLTAIEVRAVAGRIVDGDTLTVAADPALPPGAKRDRSGDVYVRLLCIDTLEIWEKDRPPAPEGLAARDLLAGLAPKGTALVLWDDGATLTLDQFGRILAFVRVADGGTELQERLVADGLSAYWRRWRDAPPALHARLEAAQQAARSAQRGAWRTQPDLLARRAAERPKPER